MKWGDTQTSTDGLREERWMWECSGADGGALIASPRENRGVRKVVCYALSSNIAKGSET